VTKGEGEIFAQNSVTSFMDGPYPRLLYPLLFTYNIEFQ